AGSAALARTGSAFDSIRDQPERQTKQRPGSLSKSSLGDGPARDRALSRFTASSWNLESPYTLGRPNRGPKGSNVVVRAPTSGSWRREIPPCTGRIEMAV